MTQSLTLKSIAPFLFTSLVLTCSAQATEALYMNHGGTLEFDAMGNSRGYDEFGNSTSPGSDFNQVIPCPHHTSPNKADEFFYYVKESVINCEISLQETGNEDEKSYINIIIDPEEAQFANVSKGVVLRELDNLFKAYDIWASYEFGKDSPDYNKFMKQLTEVIINPRRTCAAGLRENVPDGMTPDQLHQIYASVYPEIDMQQLPQQYYFYLILSLIII